MDCETQQQTDQLLSTANKATDLKLNISRLKLNSVREKREGDFSFAAEEIR